MEDYSTLNELKDLLQTESPWYIQLLSDFNIVMTLIVSISVVFGLITLGIAHHNERDKLPAFFAGFFLWGLGVAMYAIMGETIELRTHLEEKERRKFQSKH